VIFTTVPMEAAEVAVDISVIQATVALNMVGGEFESL